MLILSRRKDESIMIGDEVKVLIVDVRGDNVKLGITAPTSIVVDREEIYEAKRAVQRERQEGIDANYEQAAADRAVDVLAERKKGVTNEQGKTSNHNT